MSKITAPSVNFLTNLPNDTTGTASSEVSSEVSSKADPNGPIPPAEMQQDPSNLQKNIPQKTVQKEQNSIRSYGQRLVQGGLGALSVSLALMAVPQQAEAYPYGSNPDGYSTEVEELSANTRAFLDTIAWAEGTSGRYGYQIIFTGAYFDNFVDHPRQVRCANYRRRRLCSSASGRYQFLERTWDRVSNRLNLQDFSPRSQDLAAVELIREKGALEDVEAGRWETAIYKVAPVWASLPSPRTGRSVYGQPFKSIRQLEAVYTSNLNYYYQAVAREPIATRVPESYQPIRSTRWQQPRPLRPATSRLPSPVEPTLFPPSRIEISAPVAPRNRPNPRASSPAQSPPSWPSVFAENTYRTNNQSPSPIEDLR